MINTSVPCSLRRALLAMAAAFAVAGTATAELKPPAGFKPLFNGKDLSGWRGGTTFDHQIGRAHV